MNSWWDTHPYQRSNGNKPLGKELAGQRWVRQTDFSNADAVGYLESSDFSPNSTGWE